MPLFGKKDKTPSPGDDLKVAQKALQKGDLSHALYHIGLALGEVPNRPEAHALLNQILAQTNNPLSLVPESKEMHYGTAALRAYLLAKKGRTDEAVALLSQAMQALPDLRFLSWLADWLDSPQKLGDLKPQTVFFMLAVIQGRIRGDSISDAVTRQSIEKMLPTLTALWEKYPEQGPLGGGIGVLYRKLGRMGEAVEVGKRALQRDASRITATNYATTLRVKGDLEQAIIAFKLALELPGPVEDAALWLDIGDCYELLGQSTPALNWYEKVLAQYPQHDWAKPHALYHRFLLNHDMEALKALAELGKSNQQAIGLMMQLKNHGRPYFDYLPSPDEALINGVKQFLAKEGTITGKINIQLSSIEAPSAIYSANRLLAEKFGPHVQLVVKATLQQPDPRVPMRPVQYVLWQYHEASGEGEIPIEPRPALPPPNPKAQKLIADFALRPYSLEKWQAHAQQIGPQLGPNAIPDLLAVMVHPPDAPEVFVWWDWMQRVQIAAALVIAYTETAWEGSARRAALESLAYGPMDWSVGAGILALTLVGMTNQVMVNHALDVFQTIVKNLPKPGHVPYQDLLKACLDEIIGPEDEAPPNKGRK